MTEYLTDDWAYFLRSSRQFEKFRSPHQAIEVHETAQFGKLFRLDGHS
jgi:spermidine synthase